MVRVLSSNTLSLFNDICRAMAEGRKPEITEKAGELQGLLNMVNKELLSLLTQPERQDAGALSNFVTYSRRLKDKLVNLTALENNEPPVMTATVSAADTPENLSAAAGRKESDPD